MEMIKRMIPSKLKSYIKLEALRGKNVECPYCCRTFITFLPFGIVLRANAQCPNCGSLERHRLIWLFLQNRMDFFNRKLRLLHVAPEKLFFERFSKDENIDYVAADKFTKGYTYPAGTINMDITAIDYPDNSFDVILCSHVLEHVPDDLLAMRELYRVLKPEGWAILQVPIDKSRPVTFEDFSVTDPAQREKVFGQSDHVRIYGADYKDRLQTAGFLVRVDNYFQQFTKQERFRYGIREEDIYLCKK